VTRESSTEKKLQGGVDREGEAAERAGRDESSIDPIGEKWAFKLIQREKKNLLREHSGETPETAWGKSSKDDRYATRIREKITRRKGRREMQIGKRGVQGRGGKNQLGGRSGETEEKMMLFYERGFPSSEGILPLRGKRNGGD